MNCSTFKNKLQDYLEGNMILDMKIAMERHMEECESCRNIYEEEKALDDLLRAAFKVDTANFTSSRISIMKNIDKNRYSKNLLNKLNYHLKKYRFKYFASVAVLAFSFFFAPYVAHMSGYPGGALKSENQIAKNSSDVADMNTKNNADASRTLTQAPEVATKMAPVQPTQEKVAGFAAKSMVEEKYTPKFIKEAIDSKTEIKFGTQWKKSPDGKLSVSLDGKGANASEEGIAEIIVSNNQSSEKWKLLLTENERQFTPKFVEWLNDEYVIVIVGYGYGTTSLGGEVYMLDVNTCDTKILYQVSTNLEQVISVKKINDQLELSIIVYKDEQMSEYSTQQKVISLTNTVNNK